MTQRKNRKSAESARAPAEPLHAAKSRFLATVSHEMRTPLAGILGMADLLLATELTPEQATYVAAVKSSGESLLSLVEEVLDFSRLEVGRFEIEPSPFVLAELVEGVAELLAPRAHAKRLDIAAAVDDRLPDRVIGDAGRLRQVLLNLAGNAVKFTDAGGLAVEALRGQEPDEIMFRVRDTGIGIPAEAQKRIFREFEQVETGAARRFAGTGLGLAISQRVVCQMGGTIFVDSRPGAGATFHFSVKLPPPDGAAPAALPKLHGRAVLVVSSSPMAAPLLTEKLRGWGAAVTQVPSAADARGALRASEWHAVIVDGALGCDAAATLAGEAGRIPHRIVLVGPGERRDLEFLKRAGFSGYLIKPVRAASLAARFAARTPRDMPFAEVERAALPSSARRLSVLVAEDNDVNALLARALLVKLGHRPTVVSNGAAALAAWRTARVAAPYDLVLMDVHMPGMDGLEATRRIRELEAGARRTPIFALTANAFADDRDACLAAGMDAFLTKPLDIGQLGDMLVSLAASPAATHAA
jgi:CheY-like chemotaxis protein